MSAHGGGLAEVAGYQLLDSIGQFSRHRCVSRQKWMAIQPCGYFVCKLSLYVFWNLCL